MAGLARKSGNELSMVTGRIVENNAFIRRGGTDEATRGDAAKEVALQVDAPRFGSGRAWFCSANSLWSVGVDPLGNLCKCTEAPGDARCVFGSARDWNPADPLDTASNPDVLTGYLNAHGPITDPECRACVWLPHCAGGCPHKRLYDTGRACVPYRDDPEAFVLAVYRERLGDVPAAR